MQPRVRSNTHPPRVTVQVTTCRFWDSLGGGTLDRSEEENLGKGQEAKVVMRW